jgi:hypothetical protein
VTGTGLRGRVGAAVDRAVLGASGSALTPARAAFGELGTRFLDPMRVAIVGRVSSGKSTLANALLGSLVVPTGVEELTYNVNWLRYAPAPGIVVHFKDDRPPEHRDIADLETLTVRSDRFRAFLSEVDYLVISYPYPYLASFDLIDTPGLDSHFTEDSANTLRFLGLDESDVRASTIAHAAKADALVMVFSRGAAHQEQELLRGFQAPGSTATVASPLSSVGVLTRIEQYWDPEDEPDPARMGRRLAGRIMSEGGASRYLYHIYPLASLVGEAAVTLDKTDFADLTALAAVDRHVLEGALGFGPAFAVAGETSLPVPPARRGVMFDRFSAYGIALACELLRDGVNGLDELRDQLAIRSGLTAFRESLVEHFGHRADLIKLQRLVAQARTISAALGRGLASPDRIVLDAAAAEVTRLEFKEHAFSEIAVLRHFYDGELDVSEEAAVDLLRVTGERGASTAARLGLPETATTDELRRRAAEGHARWSARATEAVAGPTHFAGLTMRRSYEHLIHDIAQGGVSETGGAS